MKALKNPRLMMLLALGLLAATAVYGADVAPAPMESENGRITLTGALVKDGSRWALESEGTRYEIRFGSRRYLDSLPVVLKDGQEISVYGFAKGSSVIPMILVVYPEAFYLRDTDGHPLWGAQSQARAHG
jgi:hypothetical protein